MNEPYISDTLSDFILSGEEDILTHYNFSILEAIDNMEIPVRNIIENDYLDELRALSEDFEFTDKEFRIYKYKPHLLSTVLYNTPELYFVILAINDMVSKKEFCEKNIKLVSRNNMLQIMNLIYNAETEYLEDNRIMIEENKGM